MDIIIYCINFILFIAINCIECKGAVNRTYNYDADNLNITQPARNEANFSDAAAVLLLGEFTCSGSIIAKDAVVTAAVCLALIPGLKPKDVSLIIGSENRTAGIRVNVSRYFVHPRFRYYPQQMVLEHDIAVIRLETPIPLRENGGTADVVRLASGDTELDAWAGERGVVAGWGSSGSRDPMLKAVDVTVAKQDDCTKHYANLEPAPYSLTDQQLCSEPAADLCVGESGAGLRVLGEDGSWELIGITGPVEVECPTPRRPEIFTRVSHYREWIDNITTAAIVNS